MFKIFVVLFLAGYVHFTHGKTEEDLKAEFIKYAMKCLKDHPVDIAEITSLHKMEVPTKSESKCLLACAYRLEGLMTKDGRYDLDHAYKVAEEMKNGDEKRLENAKKLSDLCSKVNDVEVSDGEEGCERAGLMFKCAVENAPKYGFKVI